MHKDMANYRAVRLDDVTCKITVGIMQVYYLLKFAIHVAQPNGSTLLKIPPYDTT